MEAIDKIPSQNLSDKPKECTKVPEAPLIGLIPIPSLVIDTVKIDFHQEVDSAASFMDGLEDGKGATHG